MKEVNIMLRNVKLMFTEDTNEMLTDIVVNVMDSVPRDFYDFIGSVEYTDGSVLDVFYGCGEFVGEEWWM
jgi:hypothetical protein